jgi:hypothetical protein
LAKKRRFKTEKKVEYDFKIPEFDEHEYISLEIRKSKMSFIAFLFALLIVIVTYFIYTATHPDWRFPVVIGLFSVAALPFMVRTIKLDTTGFDWKNWLGAGAVYILSWLAIFIIVINPPFSDFAEPEIDDSITYLGTNADNNTWITLNYDEETIPNIISPERIRIRAKITDNTELRKESILVTLSSNIIPNQNQTVFEMRDDGDNFYIIEFLLTNSSMSFNPGTFEFTITAEDINGYESQITRKFKII